MIPTRYLGAALCVAWIGSVSTNRAAEVSALPPNQKPASESLSGTIEGRVFNVATGRALARARITIEGTSLETLTDEMGSYRLNETPTGVVRLSVLYVGMNSQTVAVDVPSVGTARRDFELQLQGELGTGKVVGDDVLRLTEFNVVADRELSAQAVSMNEQRFAPNIKSVVAIDEYGDRGNESIMNFLQFLPSVAIVDDAVGAGSVGLRGFPAGNTVMSVDGADFASARDGITSRTTTLIEVPMANISRVEVTKVPTPDMSASGLGGSINIISKRGFEARRPQFEYSVYTQFNNQNGLRLDTVRKNHMPQNSPKRIEPSVTFSYLHPVNSSFSFTVGGSRTWRIKEMDEGTEYSDETSTWDLIGAANGGTATAPKPVQTAGLWQNIAQVVKTDSFNVGSDWRITPNDTLSATFSYRDTYNVSSRSYFNVAYGAGATGDSTFTQGASTGVGTLTQGTNAFWLRSTKSINGTLKYTRDIGLWKFNASGAFSKADAVGREMEEGSFGATPATISNVVIRGTGRPESGSNLMHTITARLRDGTPIDVYDGGNYVLGNPTTGVADRNNSNRTSLRADLERERVGSLLLRLKVGASVGTGERSARRPGQTWAFRPNGATDANARLAKNFDVFDDEFNASAPTIFGQRMRWISSAKVFQLYQQHPDWFVLDQPAAYITNVNNSRKLIETVSAAYLRADAKFFHNRLSVVTGVRFEGTEVEGWGPLNDINAIYRRNADGSFVVDGAGRRVPITTDALAQAHLRYKERGAHATKSYEGFYPSLNVSFDLTDKVVIRTAYARTIGRPEPGNVIPGTSISEPDVTFPLITVNNPGLRPWTADSYDLSFETYFLKNGFGTVGLFQKNISGFFSQVDTPVSPELLDQLGIPADPMLLDGNYNVRTSFNGGDARLRGVEVSYRQSLGFLPSWARGVQIFGNATKMWLDGSQVTQFTGFTPSNYSAGINFIRPRFFVKLNWKYQGDTRRSAQSVNATTPPGTFTYLGARTRWGLNVQYSLTKRVALFASADDLGGGQAKNSLRYAPNTPEYAKPGRIYEYGWYTTVGVRGQF